MGSGVSCGNGYFPFGHRIIVGASCSNASDTDCPYCLRRKQPCGQEVNGVHYWWWNTGNQQTLRCLCSECARTMPGVRKDQIIHLDETGIHREQRERFEKGEI